MRGLVAATVVLVLGGCAEPPEPGPAPAAGVRFEPAAGYHVSTERFSRALPAHKIREILTVAGPDGVAVTVDVWDNPLRLPLAPWFDRHLAFLRVPPAHTWAGAATAEHVPAIFVSQPRSAQAAGRDVAVFAVRDRVYRVTCHDRDDPRSAAVYARVLATFSVERAR